MFPTAKRVTEGLSGVKSILRVRLHDGAELTVRMSPVAAKCVGIYARLPELMADGPILTFIHAEEAR